MGFRLSNNRYEEIKKIVVELFIKYDVKCIPINGFELASKMGIKIIPYSSYNEKTQKLMKKRSKDGFFVEKTEGEFYIYYDDTMNYGRINNTILHEIGHIVLDHTEESELAEAEVNFFAKYALVPPVLVYKLNINSPNKISEIFDVSIQAGYYAYTYYRKWLKYGGSILKEYEMSLIGLFKDAIWFKGGDFMNVKKSSIKLLA